MKSNNYLVVKNTQNERDEYFTEFLSTIEREVVENFTAQILGKYFA